MNPELVQAALALGGLLVGWLVRHHGIPAGVAQTPQPALPGAGNELELAKLLRDLLVKQLVEKLTAPKG
jgi:hypothetical protein